MTMIPIKNCATKKTCFIRRYFPFIPLLLSDEEEGNQNEVNIFVSKLKQIFC